MNSSKETPLVSILIPAFDAEDWIGPTIQSAIAQTWQRKEIIVVDDGSNDRTAEIARRFASKDVLVVSTENHGAAGARNHALSLSQGDYIQWLDADDLLTPDKIESQLTSTPEGGSKRMLLSGPWATFYYRAQRAQFIPTSLWQDLSPVEWLLRKLGENLHMQTATWLTSRELTEVAGPWDTRLLSDDDGEYFCRVLLASEGTRFVPKGGVFYRVRSSERVSYIANSDKKKEAIVASMKLHIQYLRSLEESERVRKACLTYLQNWYENFYPERPDLVAELQGQASRLRGELHEPRLRWKYQWMKPVFGWKTAKWVQRSLPQLKNWCMMHWDRFLYQFETKRNPLKPPAHSRARPSTLETGGRDFKKLEPAVLNTPKRDVDVY